MQLILGSSSPRRSALLAQLGLRFNILSPDVDETLAPGELPADYVSRMSNDKYAAVAATVPEPSILVAADTVVVLGDQILGKPTDSEQGCRMLSQLSANAHRVLTSVTIGPTDGENEQFVIETIVRFRTLTTHECKAYWHTGEPQDKAGGYGIQGVGAMFIDSIEGSYTNVVGLPLTETAQKLQSFGISILE